MQPLLDGHRHEQLAASLRAVPANARRPTKVDSADLLALSLTAKSCSATRPTTRGTPRGRKGPTP